MSNSSANKIVSINALGRDRSPGLRIVGDSSERLCDSLCAWLVTIREPIGEELFRLADSAQERALQSRYLDLRRDVERNWTQFIESVRHGLTEAGDRMVDAGEPLDVPDFDGLQLVDDSELAETIVVREFAAQLTECCDEELYPLDRRIAALLGHDETNDSDNPLGPRAICEVLIESGAALGLDADNRLLLMRRVERHLRQALPGFYREINADLQERGILPDLKRSYRQKPAEPPSRSETKAAAGSPGESFAGTADASALNDIVGTLQRLAAARGGPGTSSPLLHSQAGLAAVTGNTASPGSISHAFLNSLNEAQHMEWQPAAEPMLNRISVFRESGAASQASPLESVTIDIVAMLFDFIFNDDELPDAVKLLVGQLQIPVLKVAMLDHSFFANRQHPARRFLDGITGIALHWGNDGGENDPFNAQLAEMVSRIQREFETNVEIFSEAIAVLEAFATEHEVREAEVASIAAEAAARREAEEAAAEKAREALQPILEQALPATVRQFLTEHWSVVMQRKALEDSDHDGGWQETIDVAEQLVWSVAAKTDSSERMRLISTLPMLLARINAGLGGSGIGTEARQEFFDALVELHAAALKGSAADSSPKVVKEMPPTAPAPGARPGEGDLLVTRRIEEGVTIEEVMLVGAPPLRRARDLESMAQVEALQRGDWVDFVDDEGHVARERLNWLSPKKGILVFSNHRAAKAISISPTALARRVRDGTARIEAQGSSVFGRAIDGVMHSLGAA